MDRITDIEEELKKILSNFNKSKNRQYSNKTLQEKRETVKNALAESKEIVTTPADAKTVIKFAEIYQRIKQLADSILELIQAQSNNTIMAFDIKTATALLQPYDGNLDETEAFIESMELLDELTPAEHTGVMIKFIKTRITGKAKYAITNEINTIAQIKEKLLSKFSVKVSSEAILAQLRSCQQGSRKLTDFSSQIENLSRQLTKAFIAENTVTGEAAEKLAEKFAIQTLTNNVANRDTALILKASNLNTLQEATAKAIAVDNPQQSNILHFNARPRQRFGGYQIQNRPRYNQGREENRWTRPQNPNTSANYPRYQNSNTINRGNNNNAGHNQRNNGYNGQNYARNNNNFRGYQRQGNQHSSRRIRYFDSGEVQAPQPGDETHRLGENEQAN